MANCNTNYKDDVQQEITLAEITTVTIIRRTSGTTTKNESNNSSNKCSNNNSNKKIRDSTMRSTLATTIARTCTPFAFATIS